METCATLYSEGVEVTRRMSDHRGEVGYKEESTVGKTKHCQRKMLKKNFRSADLLVPVLN